MERPLWNGEPVYLGDLFGLTKGRKKSARAALSSHELGWQLRLVINDDVRQGEVCQSEEEVIESRAEPFDECQTAQLRRDGERPASVTRNASAGTEGESLCRTHLRCAY
jgi:hypothetical protein